MRTATSKTCSTMEGTMPSNDRLDAAFTKNLARASRCTTSHLDVPRGEIFGLLGHNGAGKSTTIGMMLGQVWPTRGEVKICGHDVTTHRGAGLAKGRRDFRNARVLRLSHPAGEIWKSSAITPRPPPRNASAKSSNGSASPAARNPKSKPIPTACARGWPWRRRCCRNRNC